ncbi:hypothetical protein SLEP1_g17685 [Rubroshorea leprosula]|uniref:Uncharacterized protein n=1 Tax=Rubroshorea leprosula TaxID=152421 RepID=A0AAV5J6U4_9ROSI|nr:hypothetical protein SLEP1_g17685 [Rubroshorea leprosula]
MALTKAQLDGVARSNKVRCPPERSQNEGRKKSSVLKKAKDVVVCGRKKARLPPKRGRVIMMVLESLSKSVAKLPSKSWNLLNRKNNVASEEK